MNKTEPIKTCEDSVDLDNKSDSSDFCDTDLLVLSCVKKTFCAFSEQDITTILYDIAKDAIKNKSFNLQFGRFKVYKDNRIALRATLKGKAASINQKIDYLDETKNIIINSHRFAFKSFEYCKVPIILIAIYGLGNNINTIKEGLIKKRKDAGIETNYRQLGGYANLTALYNSEEFIILCPLPREKSSFSAMDLLYDIEEQTYIENGNVVFDSDIITEGLKRHAEKGLELQSNITVIPVLKIIMTTMFFSTSGLLLTLFIYYSFKNGMYLFVMGGFLMILSVLFISTDYYHKISSNKYLVKIGNTIL